MPYTPNVCLHMEISESTKTVYICRLPADGHIMHHMTYGWNPND